MRTVGSRRIPAGIASEHGAGETVSFEALEDDTGAHPPLVGEFHQPFVQRTMPPEAVAFHKHTHQDAGLWLGGWLHHNSQAGVDAGNLQADIQDTGIRTKGPEKDC